MKYNKIRYLKTVFILGLIFYSLFFSPFSLGVVKAANETLPTGSFDAANCNSFSGTASDGSSFATPIQIDFWVYPTSPNNSDLNAPVYIGNAMTNPATRQFNFNPQTDTVEAAQDYNAKLIPPVPVGNANYSRSAILEGKTRTITAWAINVDTNGNRLDGPEFKDNSYDVVIGTKVVNCSGWIPPTCRRFEQSGSIRIYDYYTADGTPGNVGFSGCKVGSGAICSSVNSNPICQNVCRSSSQAIQDQDLYCANTNTSFAITGKVINSVTNQGIPNIHLDLCRADLGDNGSATTNSQGNFSVTVPFGHDYCVRAKENNDAASYPGFILSGYGVPIKAAAHSYECQRAGTQFSIDACGGNRDRSDDNTYDFTYSPLPTLTPSPTPTPTSIPCQQTGDFNGNGTIDEDNKDYDVWQTAFRSRTNMSTCPAFPTMMLFNIWRTARWNLR